MRTARSAARSWIASEMGFPARGIRYPTLCRIPPSLPDSRRVRGPFRGSPAILSRLYSLYIWGPEGAPIARLRRYSTCHRRAGGSTRPSLVVKSGLPSTVPYPSDRASHPSPAARGRPACDDCADSRRGRALVEIRGHCDRGLGVTLSVDDLQVHFATDLPTWDEVGVMAHRFRRELPRAVSNL